MSPNAVAPDNPGFVLPLVLYRRPIDRDEIVNLFVRYGLKWASINTGEKFVAVVPMPDTLEDESFEIAMIMEQSEMVRHLLAAGANVQPLVTSLKEQCMGTNDLLKDAERAYVRMSVDMRAPFAENINKIKGQIWELNVWIDVMLKGGADVSRCLGGS